jgi:hypothetical protein
VGRHSETADDDKSADVETETDALDSDDSPQRSAKADAFWEKVGVAPVEIALPKGVGLTLRAYRMSDTVELASEDETGDETETAATTPVAAKKPTKSSAATAVDNEDEPDEDLEDDDITDDESDSTDDEDESATVEEIPIFLSHRGELPLFETAEALVTHVKSGAPTDLSAIDSWDELVKGIKPEYVVATDDDSYELDLVVKNLRGGHDSWDAELIVGAGELARDLGYALRLPSVMSTLSAGSPLDDLDNALRAMVDGGLRAMFAKRRARKVGAQQTSLAWRGIINKIGESVDWRN